MKRMGLSTYKVLILALVMGLIVIAAYWLFTATSTDLIGQTTPAVDPLAATAAVLGMLIAYVLFARAIWD